MCALPFAVLSYLLDVGGVPPLPPSGPPLGPCAMEWMVVRVHAATVVRCLLELRCPPVSAALTPFRGGG
jgi:hypothetical protein